MHALRLLCHVSVRRPGAVVPSRCAAPASPNPPSRGVLHRAPSKRTFRRIRLNYAWAFSYNLLALPIAAVSCCVFSKTRTRAPTSCFCSACGTTFKPASAASSLNSLLAHRLPGTPPPSTGRALPSPALAAAALGGRGGHGPQLRHRCVLQPAAAALPPARAGAAAPGGCELQPHVTGPG